MRLHRSRDIVWLALSALLLLPATWAKAQGGAAGAPTKNAVINVRQAIVTTAEGKRRRRNCSRSLLRGKASWKTFRSRCRICRAA